MGTPGSPALLLSELRPVNRFDLAAVAAQQRVPADNCNVLEHALTVFQVAHSTALVVRPAHGNLIDAEAPLETYEQNLWIETPPLDGLELKDRLRSFARKGLETALCIGETQTHDHARHRVKAAPKNLAVQRLADGLARALEPARANGDVGTVG